MSRWSLGLLLTASALLLVGCEGGDEEGAGDNLDGQVVALETEVPLRAPAYQPASGGALLALTEDGDGIVKLEVEEPEGGLFAGPDEQDPRLVVAGGADLEGESAGENMALDRNREGRAFVPQPELDHIQSLQTDDLLEIRTFDAGEPPVRVAMSGPQNAIYALSADGKTVTAVSFDTFDPVAERRVDGGEETLIATSPDIEDEFWLAGPEGVSAHAFGTDPFPEGEIPLDAAALAVDAENSERAYASETGTGRIVAVEPERSGGGLGVVEERDLGEPVLYLAAEPGFLHAVTPQRLVTLDATSLETVQAVELPPEAGEEPNGIAVGEEGVFVTLEGERLVLLFSKPPTEE
ncbi:hypothetical protein GBA65_07350 [Rubrobacter marinus]|uniref:Lipoprotein n=1 Tax=Rubrobacter marinus TaxID=2653852 RepID=A0A6G8PVZ1_9ACTN|nr:hypothetical protein [Rubrobacter marinus]QIN78369.1 hypothetical protein GBA65_07350 [Rubrobacter marinus]